MIPREEIGVAEVPGGPPLRLIRHGRDFIIMLERNELMSSRMSGSEKALATMTLDRLGNPPGAAVLIGGYGMGFTLRAVLARLGTSGKAVVAELVPGIIDWARGPMQDLADGCLDDPRVDLRMVDVGWTIATARVEYDAILLDVDNGPDGLTRPDNDVLYTPDGLAAARRALRPGGILAVWSAAPDPAFTRRLGRAGFQVEEQRVRARENGKGPQHTLWFAQRG
ncbi:spermidine synthase [Croceibacterium sp. TMG7-5b_MA50]|uniref:spermidine synthase n=1 Tax=Croceibacterium sp. TMG7-5b_MA50 TaxID=3121290 RepID=UPI0032213B20